MVRGRAMKRPWLALDQHFVDDERIVDLGDAHGAGAVTAYIALLCTAKQSGTAGTVEVGYRALARKAFLEGGAEQAERIVAAAAELGLLKVESNAGGGRCRITINPRPWSPRRPAIPAAIRRAVRLRDGNTCQLCGGEVTEGDVDLDHILPWAQGGPDTVENLRVTHSQCNRRRPRR